ncbi:MAG: hypothetical protein ACXWC6_04590 [Ramlibacter sp.]
MNSKRIASVLALAAAVLLGGCAVYPAYPAYPAYTTTQVVNGNPPTVTQGGVAVAPAPVYVAPAPVYVAPAPVYYGGPFFYPSISIFGRFGGGGGHHGHHR